MSVAFDLLFERQELLRQIKRLRSDLRVARRSRDMWRQRFRDAEWGQRQLERRNGASSTVSTGVSTGDWS